MLDLLKYLNRFTCQRLYKNSTNKSSKLTERLSIYIIRNFISSKKKKNKNGESEKEEKLKNIIK